MIHVRNLVKYYGDYAAVRNVSFDVQRGQVVGFLGPNGAGKSTTMRILAGYMTATSGSATINGVDVFWDPVEARRQIGYMPESCPLYPEMRVAEYLRYRAGLKGLHGTDQKKRVGHVVDCCWLSDVQRQLIGTLSKGYRQRVGLADALLADPPVLMLDEPTAGLDPTQIRETRKLLRELGQQHTILLSTHILSEVEVSCSSVIIISKGRLAASGTLEEVARAAGQNTLVVVELEGTVHQPESVKQLAGVTRAEWETTPRGTRMRMVARDVADLSHRLHALAAQQGWRVRELRLQQQTLEDLFVQIVDQPDENSLVGVAAS